MNKGITSHISVELICEAIVNHEGVCGISYEELVRLVSDNIEVIDYLWEHYQVDLFELF